MLMLTLSVSARVSCAYVRSMAVDNTCQTRPKRNNTILDSCTMTVDAATIRYTTTVQYYRQQISTDSYG